MYRSEYEINQLRDAPPPPSKHYLDDEEGIYETPKQVVEPDYIEFEG